MITRPVFNIEKMANDETLEYYRNRIHKSLNRIIEGKKVNLFKLKDTPLDIARTYILNTNEKDVIKHLQLTLQLGLAHFKRALATNEVEINIGNIDYKISAIDESYGASSYDWFFLYSLAQIIRSDEWIEELVNLDISLVNPISHPFWSKVCEYLKAVTLKNEKIVYHCIGQIRQVVGDGAGLFIDEDQNKSVINLDHGSELLSTLWSPILDLYDSVFYDKSKKFNTILHSYLVNKKNYIIQNELQDDPRYWIDFPAMAVCAFAIDRGIEVTVESEYIPSWMYNKKES